MRCSKCVTLWEKALLLMLLLAFVWQLERWLSRKENE